MFVRNIFNRMREVTLRTRLLTTHVGIPLLVVLLLLFLSVRTTQKILVHEISNDLLHVAQNAAGRIDDILDDQLLDMRGFSQADIFEGSDDQAKTRYLRKLVETNPAFNALSVVDLSGKTIASSDESRIGKGLPTSGQNAALFEKAKGARQGEVFFGDAFLDETTGRLAVLYLTPVTDETNTIVEGLLILSFDLQEIEKIVLGLAEQTRSKKPNYLLTNRGEVIFTSDPEAERLKPLRSLPHNPDLQKALEADATSFGHYTDLQGKKVFAAFADLAEYGLNQGGDWWLLTTALEEDAFAPARALRNRLLLFGTMSLLIALFIALWVTRGIVRPVQSITDIADTISREGGLSRKIDVEGVKFAEEEEEEEEEEEALGESKNEVTRLAMSLNRMLRSMKRSAKKEQELAAEAAAGEKERAEELQKAYEALRIKTNEASNIAEHDRKRAAELEKAAQEMEKAQDATLSLMEDLDLRRKEIEQREQQLQERAKRLEEFQRFSAGRELTMVQLKEEVNALALELGRPAPHPEVEDIRAQEKVIRRSSHRKE